jgi:hypothetical protein
MVDLANSCKKNNCQRQGKTSQFYVVKTYKKQETNKIHILKIISQKLNQNNLIKYDLIKIYF